MKISELLSEATSRPVELRDVIKFFPKTYMKVLRAKLGTDQITYHGHQLQHADYEGDLVYGPAYEGAVSAVDDANSDQQLDVELEMDLTPLGDEFDGINSGHHFTFEAEIQEKSEVYVGYSPSQDALYMGFDCWISENEFNDAWDNEFEQAAGEQYDSDNPAHEAVFNKVWNYFKDRMMYGMLFEVTEHGGRWHAEEIYCLPGTFYQGIYKFPGFQHLDLIDLRTK